MAWVSCSAKLRAGTLREFIFHANKIPPPVSNAAATHTRIDLRIFPTPMSKLCLSDVASKKIKHSKINQSKTPNVSGAVIAPTVPRCGRIRHPKRLVALKNRPKSRPGQQGKIINTPLAKSGNQAKTHSPMPKRKRSPPVDTC
ncbi:MAG: hypothetical protein DRP83_09405 [Planctomycetota bacterium]|nr:MAG: hypothetical protein DRP83_09405 [Planctomycetota bacterium]